MSSGLELGSFPRRTLLKQLATESLIYGVSGAATSFLNLLLLPFLTRVFSPEDYGVIGLVTTTITLLTIFVALGLDSAAGRWYWDSEKHSERKRTIASWLWVQMAISIIIAIFLFVFSGPAAKLFVNRGDASRYFQLGALTLPLGVLTSTTIGWLRMERRPLATGAFSLAVGLINVLSALTLVFYFQAGIAGIFLGQIIAFGLGSAGAVLMMRDWINPSLFRWSRTREMLAYSLPLVPGSIAFWVVNLSGRYFVQGFASTAEVGLFQVGAGIASGMALLTGAFQQAWGPFSLSIYKQEGSKQIYADIFLLYLWVTCLLSALISMFSKEILALITTEEYIGADRVIYILCFNYVLIGLNYIAVLGSTIMKSIKHYGIAILISGVLSILFNFLLVPRYGKEGAALATLLSQIFVPVYVFYKSQKDYPIPYRFKAGGFIFFYAFASCALFHMIPDSSWYTSVAVRGSTVAVFLFLPYRLEIINFPSWLKKLEN